MRLLALLFVAVAVAAPLPAAERDEAAARKALVGVWKGFAVEGEGESPDRGATRRKRQRLKQASTPPFCSSTPRPATPRKQTAFSSPA